VTADWVAVVFIVAATAAVAVAVLVRGRRRADLSDVLAGRTAARPVPLSDIYDGLDEHFRTAAAILQPDQETVTDEDVAVFWADYDTYRYEARMPGERAL
jgi:hypothetical protein